MTKYYDHIFLCIVKSNSLSRDHIIAITSEKENLKYAIVLNEKNRIGVQEMEN